MNGKSVTLRWLAVALGVIAAVSQTRVAQAAEQAPLEQELQSLSAPGDRPPPAVSSEKMYAVQNRYSPLRLRHELALGGVRNVSSDFLNSNEVTAAYRFYLSNRWFLGLTGNYVFNSFNNAGNRLLDQVQRIPDVAYTKDRVDLAVGFNVFYGKLRITMDQVFYFDQYVTLGPGIVDTVSGRPELGTSRQLAAVADAGIVFWLGHSGSLRLGVKDYYFHEVRRLSEGNVHNFLAHVDFGLLLGGSQGI